jgi:MFS family permease
MDRRHARRVIGFINAAHVIDHMHLLIFPTAMLGMGAAFDLPYGELLALSLGGFIAFGAGSLPSGWLGDRWSRRNMMAVFFIGIGAATVLVAFASTPAMLAAALTLVGLFASIYHPVGTAMLTAHAETEKLGWEIGVNGVWGNLGVAFAALVAGGLTQYVGWQAAFIVPGLVSIGVGIAFLATVPDVPVPKRPGKKAADLPRSVVVRAFAVLALVTVAGGVVFNATTVTLPKVFDERLTGLAATPFGVGAFAFAVYTIGATSQLIVGRLVDRHSLRTVFLPLSALQAPCLFLAVFAWDWAMVALGIGMMFAVFGQVTINDAIVARYTDDRWRARAYSVRYFVSFGAAALAVPLVALLHGAGADGGFGAVFQALAILGALVFVGACVMPHRPDEVAPKPATQPAE